MDEVLGSHAAQFISICESVKLEKQVVYIKQWWDKHGIDINILVQKGRKWKE